MSDTEYKAATRAAWAVTYGKPCPPPPKGITEARWNAMIKQIIRQIEENS